jgi:hypothetical protein
LLAEAGVDTSVAFVAFDERSRAATSGALV